MLSESDKNANLVILAIISQKLNDIEWDDGYQAGVIRQLSTQAIGLIEEFVVPPDKESIKKISIAKLRQVEVHFERYMDKFDFQRWKGPFDQFQEARQKAREAVSQFIDIYESKNSEPTV